jgi:hypothetical protein
MKKSADLSKPLHDIYRILYCGFCKQVWQMRGTMSVKGNVVERMFDCPYCGEIVKIDYIKNPTRMAIDTKEWTYPMWNNSEAIRFNRQLLGLDETKGTTI